MPVDGLIQLLSAHRFRYQDEAELQAAIGQILTDARVEHIREYSLSNADRVDFFLPATGLALEVKCRGALDPALRQVDRYMTHNDVRGVVLASSRAWGRCRVDNAGWQGKPFGLVYLRRVM